MRTFLLPMVLLVCSKVAFGEPPALDGAKFTVEIKPTSRTVPFSLPYAGPMPENPVIHAVSGGVDIKLAGIKGAVAGVLPANLPADTMTFTIHNKDFISEPVAVEKRPSEDAIDVRVINVDKFTTYYYKKDDRKPYLWPLLGEGGAPLTREWSVTGKEGKSKDHPHHVSFWSALGNVNGADFWEYGDRTGWQVPDKVEFGSGGAAGWIVSHDTWVDKDKKPVVAEERSYIFYNTPASGRLIDVTVKFTAEYGDAKFGDTKEGGIVAFRMNDDLREQGGTGKITTSEGAVGEKAAWGKPAAWCDYSGTLEGFGERGIAVMDSPQSFRYPTHWHVRGYGLMAANPFGYHDFYNGTKNGDHTLKNGETLSFSYRIYIHSGDATVADVAGHYRDFANPPVAKWIE